MNASRLMKTRQAAPILLATSFLGAAAFGYLAVFDLILNGPQSEPGGAFRYLTFWNVLIQLTFHVLGAILHSVSPLSLSEAHQLQRLRWLRSFYFESLAFPFACYVFVIYWCVYLLDPGVVDSVQSQLMNQLKHSLMLALLTVPLCLEDLEESNPWLTASVSVAVLSGYCCLLGYMSAVFDYRPYGYLTLMNWGQRAVAFIIAHLFLLGLNLAGRALKRVKKNGIKSRVRGRGESAGKEEKKSLLVIV